MQIEKADKILTETEKMVKWFSELNNGVISKVDKFDDECCDREINGLFAKMETLSYL